MADPTGKAARVARSRAACASCRSTKQRCDGPSRIPCRRCELYGLECEYPPSSGPAPSKPAARPAAASVPPPIYSGVASNDGAMSERLREISDRLRSIESSLEHVHLHSKDQHESPPSSFPSLAHHSSEQDSPNSSASQSHDAAHLSGNTVSNPVQTVNETIEAIEAIAKEQSPGGGASSSSDWSGIGGRNMSMGVSPVFAGMSIPDAIVRGIVSVDEAEASFHIFFAKLSPWVMFFNHTRDRDASSMRERSPLLFHVMLLSTGYYLMGASERGAQVYYALTSLLNELLGPILISAQPHQINTDLIRALSLLILWKPVPFASLYASGITEPDAAEQAAKLNGTSSAILVGVIIRTACSLSLPAITTTFAKSFSPTIAIAPQVISDLRLFYWLLVVDTHGALTTGRAGQVDIQDALRTTRLFSSLKLQPFDVRLAATVELYATAKIAVSTVWTGAERTIAPHELRKFNKEMDDWEAYWTEPLKDAGAEDPLAYTASVIFANFVRLTVNSTVVSRWRVDRNLSLSRGGSGRPPLSREDWGCIQRCIDAAEKIVFSLSIESRTEGVRMREVNWPEKAPGEPRPVLHLDPLVVDAHRTAFDPITCLVYVYTLILAVRLANTGLIRCELNTLTEDYEAGVSLNRPQRLTAGAKLGRLLELCASFLETIAPTPSHPAKRHARMLRTILVAGTMGQLLPTIDPDLAAIPCAPPNDGTYPSSYLASTSNESSALPTPGSTFSLPVPPPLLPNPPPNSVAEPGLALASILGGISPSFFGDMGFFDAAGGGTLWGAGGEGATALEGMAVDWDSLEKSMWLQSQTPGATMGDMGMFSHPVDGTGYFGSR